MRRATHGPQPAKHHSVKSASLHSARRARLVYVSDHERGYRRMRRGKAFFYFDGEEKVTDPVLLERFKKLRIPPAWKNVWLCKSENGHLQATGLDAKGRKQYRYHTGWNETRNKTKFQRLLEFGQKLPALRRQIEKDISRRELDERKVLAAVINLMENTYIRIGNAAYEKANGSYGLTTLKDNHVKITGAEMRFSFRGKKGIYHNISLTDRRLAKIVKQCRDIPGRELFQYYTSDGNRHTIDSGSVNAYLQQITGENFTAKDFRTWSGTLNALRAFRKCFNAGNLDGTKKQAVEVIDEVSRCLGNSRDICRKYYIHPCLMQLFENGKLGSFFGGHKIKAQNGLSADENLLLHILSCTKYE